MRIRYHRQTETGAEYSLIQAGQLLHAHSRVPQLELRWRNERWVPERNWLEREYTYTLDVSLDEYLARFLPHLNGKALVLAGDETRAGQSGLTHYASFRGRWFNFESEGHHDDAHSSIRPILRTTAEFYGVASLFG